MAGAHHVRQGVAQLGSARFLTGQVPFELFVVTGDDLLGDLLTQLGDLVGHRVGHRARVGAGGVVGEGGEGSAVAIGAYPFIPRMFAGYFGCVRPMQHIRQRLARGEKQCGQ